MSATAAASACGTSALLVGELSLPDFTNSAFKAPVEITLVHICLLDLNPRILPQPSAHSIGRLHNLGPLLLEATSNLE